jgi:hypothetical protein
MHSHMNRAFHHAGINLAHHTHILLLGLNNRTPPVVNFQAVVKVNLLWLKERTEHISKPGRDTGGPRGVSHIAVMRFAGVGIIYGPTKPVLVPNSADADSMENRLAISIY